MPDVEDDPQLAYSVHEHDARFEVCAASGRVIMVCNDESSASHYVALLNEAHRAGYKLGLKAGRRK